MIVVATDGPLSTGHGRGGGGLRNCKRQHKEEYCNDKAPCSSGLLAVGLAPCGSHRWKTEQKHAKPLEDAGPLADAAAATGIVGLTHPVREGSGNSRSA